MYISWASVSKGLGKLYFSVLILCDSFSLEFALIFFLSFLTHGSQKWTNLEPWFSICFLPWYLHYYVQSPIYLILDVYSMYNWGEVTELLSHHLTELLLITYLFYQLGSLLISSISFCGWVEHLFFFFFFQSPKGYKKYFSHWIPVKLCSQVIFHSIEFW